MTYNTNSKTLKLQTAMVYGPVGSRRIGLSLGVNISPVSEKFCSFNCVYCHYGWTDTLSLDATKHQGKLPGVDDLTRQLEEYKVDRYLLDHITFSGNGEATYHPDFGRAVDIVIEFRDKYVPQSKTAILSNSSMVMKQEVREALKKLDRCIMKLDAGDEVTFRKVNRPPSQLRFEDIIAGLRELKKFETQSIFLDGSVSNSSDEAVDSWIKVMLELKPYSMQIYTLDRAPADDRLQPVSRERMRDIFLKTKKAGLPVNLY
ncbi:Fe-S oxidoreductase [candidate division LCP-89 bacterium B3_LCP]|uniref:Fe-S oxidoreductase n=1 Tax=candidate division LCP-89 bacterium B3_LCP TaxID=2012998 RepID=A0A532V3R2_UNCL8|nr:MAG: Fe-S oxidoreductase [candidate division LCP-89 bacterium B3_LCP]